MSQSKAQLTNPIGAVNITGGVNATGVVTATTFIGDGTALTGIALTGNINTTGIITASEFYGYGGDLDNVGLGTEDSINTTGIITASAFYGDGSGLTGIGGDLTPLTFTPSNGSIDVGLTTNISILFNKPIQAGVGTITLRTNAADGAIVESYDVGISSSISISAGSLTINPTADLVGLTTHFVVIPAGALQDAYGVDSNTLIDNYSFITEEGFVQGELWGWGNNNYGELGQDDVAFRSSPVQIPGTQWTSITINYDITIATKSDNTLWVWGGQYMPFNSTIYRSSPVQVPGTQWSIDQKGIATGLTVGYALKTDGTLWGWGTNPFGELGQTNTTSYSSPVQIPGTQWRNVGVDNYHYHVAATKTDGTLWMWGANYNGQLGQNNLTQYSSPRQIPGTQWDYGSMGSNRSSAIKTDGTIWTWGENTYGGLGQNNETQYSSPVQVPGSQWSTIAMQNIHYLATKTDGTLWGWGYNEIGTLAQNDKTNYSSPRQIPGTQWGLEYKDLASLYRASGALKSDGTLWMWGDQTHGVLAQSNITNYSSPVQVPGTQWYTLSRGGVYQQFAIKQV